MSEFDLVGEPAESSRQRWEDRFKKSREDRVILTRFLAVCLIGIAVVNVVPAILYWRHASSTEVALPLPRWVYLQAFAALLHIVYAVFLIHLSDWASLRAVAYAMLAVAMTFGLLSTGLVVGDGRGFVPRFLELEQALVQRAGLWCVAMLCVATLASYLGGRESSRWQRAEKLLFGMRNQT